MVEKYSAAKLAVDLVTEEYDIEEPFEVQQKIYDVLNIEFHISTIVEHLGVAANKLPSTLSV
jgi:hypothetical protein